MSRRDTEPDTHDTLLRLPADVEQSDRLVANLTARQLVQLAAAAILLWFGWQISRPLPWTAFAVFGLPVTGVTVAIVLGRRDGLGMDRWLAGAVRHLRRPRHLLPAPLAAPPPGVAELPLPVTGIDAEGVLALHEGCAVLTRTGTVNFALRTTGEQQALVAGVGRWLNALTGPAQILVRSRRLDLAPLAAHLREQAPTLPHPLLEDAALEHADFLAWLEAERDLLTRDVLVAHREPTSDEAARLRALRRAHESGSLLAAAEVDVRVLDAHHCWSVLGAACDGTAPPHPRPALPGDTVTHEGGR
ncbi:PrgI family protein [Streptacidiphilus neutrinimicus]|uniref:PrgI family protein n=1 Tax=Streptacidiphilus neutrinimicus TaxID=105420 RepID=UPI00069329AB|nr:PrgI family protein [Streptacidiphilus neutrinimicus]